MRIDRYLSHMGYGSRKEVKHLIQAGRVSVNDELVKKTNCHVDEFKDEVRVDGQRVNYQEFTYLLMNKPGGVISATEDNYHATVLDCLTIDDFREDLFPVGRLDIDTTGLLLLTNNGQLAHQLTSPKKQVAKQYQALIAGQVTETTIEKFAAGLDLGDFTSQPAQLVVDQVDAETDQTMIRVTVYEGKYHQVKRMFQACDLEVIRLHRLTMGPLVLDADLAPGQYRRLNDKEKEDLIPYGYR